MTRNERLIVQALAACVRARAARIKARLAVGRMVALRRQSRQQIQRLRDRDHEPA